MPNLSVSDASSLADLRVEIDRLDEAMHNLLMQRGEIIDRLIRVKQTQESGSAFRPAREAEMMRRLLERHKGILPLDTAESIWRVIIATFTFVQAPFSVHADLSAGDAMMRDSARFHFGFTVPFVPHMGAPSVVAAVSGSKGDLGLVPAFDIAGAGAWWNALEPDEAPKIIARLPFVERADHPAGLAVFVISRASPEAMVREVETWSVRVAGWNAQAAREVRLLAQVLPPLSPSSASGNSHALRGNRRHLDHRSRAMTCRRLASTGCEPPLPPVRVAGVGVEVVGDLAHDAIEGPAALPEPPVGHLREHGHHVRQSGILDQFAGLGAQRPIVAGCARAVDHTNRGECLESRTAQRSRNRVCRTTVPNDRSASQRERHHA